MPTDYRGGFFGWGPSRIYARTSTGVDIFEDARLETPNTQVQFNWLLISLTSSTSYNGRGCNRQYVSAQCRIS